MSLATASAAVEPARARPVASQRAGAGADRRARLIRRPARSPVPTRATSPAAADPAANADGMYDGTVFFHLYPELKSRSPSSARSSRARCTAAKWRAPIPTTAPRTFTKQSTRTTPSTASPTGTLT